MSRTVALGVVLVLVLVLVAVGVVAAARVLERPPLLPVVSARTEDVSRMLAVTGRVEAGRTVLVSPQVAGRITEIVRYEGDRVHKDEILARLADVSARSDVTEQQAELVSKAVDLAQANLDRENSNDVMRLLRELSRDEGTAFLISTHDESIASRCDRILSMVDGRLLAAGGGQAKA